MLSSRAAWGLVAAALCAGVLGWALGRSVSRPERQAAPSQAEGTAHDLQLELAAALDQNQQLSAELEWLQLQVDLLSGRHAASAEGEAPPADAVANAADPASKEAKPAGEAGTDEAAQGAEPRPDEAEKEGWFDANGLTRAGLRPDEVERLQEVFDASEMRVIELEHQARREGWYRSPRYMQALHGMRSELRSDLGEEDFDLLLYASGRDNRVVIDGLLTGSPGERAGLRQGDVVLSYAGERVFKAPELKRATVEGAAGDRITIDVIRDGEEVRIYAQRGPLGAKLAASRILPELR